MTTDPACPSRSDSANAEPVVIDLSGSRFVPILLLLAGVVGAGLTLCVMPGGRGLSLVPSLALGVALVLLGMRGITQRKVVLLTRTTVTVKTGAMGIGWQWSEPLANYAGVFVACESYVVRHGSILKYAVHLWHREARRRLVLARYDSQTEAEAFAARLCRALNLPGLVRAGDGFEKVAPEDVGKSILELASEGKVASVSFGPSSLAFPPWGIEVREDQPEVVLAVTKKDWWSAWTALIGLAVSAVVVWAGFSCGGRWFYVGLTGLLAVAAAVTVLIGELFTIRTIRLGPGEIELGRETPWGGICLRTVLPAGEVKRVHIDRNRTPQTGDKADIIGRVVDMLFDKLLPASDAVVIETDARSRTIGDGLPREGLEWLRDCVLWATNK